MTEVLGERIARLEGLYAKGKSGEIAYGVQISSPDSSLLQVLQSLGIADYLMLNMEHSLVGKAELRNAGPLLDAIGIPWVVKVNHPVAEQVIDAQNAGAYGVLLPNTESMEELRELQIDCRLPPVGDRGICPMAPALLRKTASFVATDKLFPDALTRGRRYSVADFQTFINDHFLYIPTVEGPGGVESYEAMLEADDLPIIHFGWLDLFYAVHEQLGDEGFYRLKGGLYKNTKESDKMLMEAAPNSFAGTNEGGPPIDPESMREMFDARGSDLVYVDDANALAWGLVLVESVIRGRNLTTRPGRVSLDEF